jgi:4-amino-4-deoxy-L-arabinose transferase-like glycosyltransferase
MLVGQRQDPSVRQRPSRSAGPAAPGGPAPVVEVVVPVYNEARDLEPRVRELHAYLCDSFPFTFRVTIADNASTDGTWPLARRLAGELEHVHALHLDAKGRGRALKAAWSTSPAAVLAYMDVDLSTGLEALLPLVAPLVSGHSDLAIGTRLSRGARVVRGPKREVISRGYNLLLRAVLGARFSDAQCGFKAIRADAARRLLPRVRDDAWFFDTELLVLAERSGLRIHEVPVDWVDDPDSRVDLLATALADLRGIGRLRGDPLAGAGRQGAARPARRGAARLAAGRHALHTHATHREHTMTTTIPNPLERAWRRGRDWTAGAGRSPSWRRLLRGREADPAWVRPSLLALLVATALLYLWGLGASGYANAFYSAAVQAGTRSWKAFFFGSSDASNFITVDKPPLALWPAVLAARVFGVNSWTLLVPQALAGVATVGVVHATVRRWFAPAAALLAGAVVALTPVAVLMFRFNNPDALLTLLLALGAYATVRATERGRTGWLVLAATLVGLGFLTKMLQAFLVVPAFALAYLVAAPVSLRRRIGRLLLAGVAMLVSAGWWVAAVQLIPAGDRPYIGGSQDNSVLNLIFGYNGFGRITGNETGSVGGAMGWGRTGLLRLFGTDIGGQVTWLLPAALLLPAVGLWVTRRAVRTDRTRAALLLWGGWLLVTGLVFSFMRGIFHPYYTVALAPALGALVGIGGWLLWANRERAWARLTMAGAVALTGVWSFLLLQRSPGWHPWLAPLVLIGGLGVAALLGALPGLRRAEVAAVLAGAVLVAFIGPAAYAFDTAATAHTGAIPSAGPAVAGRFGPGGFPGRGGAFGNGQGPFGQGPGGFGGFGNGNPFGGQGPGGFGGGGRGGLGGLLESGTPSAELVALLRQGAQGYTWAAAAVGSNSAAGVQLASGEPVMAIGGFNGTDPAPTLAQFQRYVSEGRIHYFIGGGGFGGGPGGFGGGGSTTGSQIASWVQQNFSASTVGGVTIYDLSAAAGGQGA